MALLLLVAGALLGVAGALRIQRNAAFLSIGAESRTWTAYMTYYRCHLIKRGWWRRPKGAGDGATRASSLTLAELSVCCVRERDMHNPLSLSRSLAPALTQTADAPAAPSALSSPGAAGHALQFRDHVVVKKDFKVRMRASARRSAAVPLCVARCAQRCCCIARSPPS